MRNFIVMQFVVLGSMIMAAVPGTVVGVALDKMQVVSSGSAAGIGLGMWCFTMTWLGSLVINSLATSVKE